jgi:hypothetical protein
VEPLPAHEFSVLDAVIMGEVFEPVCTEDEYFQTQNAEIATYRREHRDRSF